MEHTLSCTIYGAYQSLQQENGQYFCVDKYGCSASGLLDKIEDCEDYFYYSAKHFNLTN